MTTTTADTIVPDGTGPVRYRALGFTDDVLACEVCGKQELKGTVRLLSLDADGNDGDVLFAGVVCAGRLSGRKPAAIRTEATRADKAASDAVRAARSAWSDAYSSWFCRERDLALGRGARFPEISAWSATPAHQAADAAWRQANPAPPHAVR